MCSTATVYSKQLITYMLDTRGRQEVWPLYSQCRIPRGCESVEKWSLLLPQQNKSFSLLNSTCLREKNIYHIKGFFTSQFTTVRTPSAPNPKTTMFKKFKIPHHLLDYRNLTFSHGLLCLPSRWSCNPEPKLLNF
jgi:hypothetical protein